MNKKIYAKPVLTTYGDVAELTETRWRPNRPRRCRRWRQGICRNRCRCFDNNKGSGAV